jgi:hypothetical protein
MVAPPETEAAIGSDDAPRIKLIICAATTRRKHHGVPPRTLHSKKPQCGRERLTCSGLVYR